MTYSKRYDRQIALPEIGLSGQRQLADAKVLVIGAGGLGCAVLQQLAAAGVGCIGIVDGDVVEATNLHRQFLYANDDCGKSKATVSAAVISKQNPEIKITVYTYHFTAENAFAITADYQIIVDCTDTIAMRYLINDVALVKSIPMVYASVHKFEGQLSVFNYQAGPTYRCLFPEKSSLSISNCDEAGVLGIIPNTLGILQATEVLKILLEIGAVLTGKLLLYDGLQHTMQTIAFEKNPIEIQNGLRNGLTILNRTRKEVKNINAADFFAEAAVDTTLVIDLREVYEESKLALSNVKNVPLDQLENYLEDYDKNQKIILFCQYGNNSLLAAQYLLKNGFTNLFHLQGGIAAIAQTNIQ